MTSPAPPPKRTKWALRGALAGLVALVVAYARCGPGFGTGGGASLGTGTEPPAPKPVAMRCQLRLDSAGLWILDATGQRTTTIEASVAACKATPGADVVVTGDATQGSWESLRSALDGAGVPTFVKGAAAAP